jgi:hypothetical protein
MQKCPDCQATLDDNAIFCDQCGRRLKPKPGEVALAPAAAPQPTFPAAPLPGGPACPACGYINLPGEAFCANCGMQQVIASEAVPPTPASAAGPSRAVPVQQYVSRPCPTCGASNPPGEPYCHICGFGLVSLDLAPAAAERPVPEAATLATSINTPSPVPAAPAAPIQTVGRLLSVATNINIRLPAQPEILLGRTDPERDVYPDVDLSEQGSASNSVSRRHARLLVQGGQVFVEDLNSTNSTYLNRQRIPPGQRFLLNPGDELRLGGVVLVYYPS